MSPAKTMCDANHKRLLFPRGVHQPERGFRFSIDALLLACFARPKDDFNILDLGTGCGVVGLGLLLANPDLDLQITGVDHMASVLELARKNVCDLGFQDQFSLELVDVRKIRQSKRFCPESFDLVVSNPPYRKPSQGRLPPDGYACSARVEQDAVLEDFLGAAVYLLKNKGVFTVIYLAERLTELFTVLHALSLEPKRLKTVHSTLDKPARLVLVEARKNGRPGLEVCPPLILYQDLSSNHEVHCLSDSALDFCPFLRCNARRIQRSGTLPESI